MFFPFLHIKVLHRLEQPGHFYCHKFLRLTCLITFTYLLLHVWLCPLHDAYVEVRGRLVGVTSLPVPSRFLGIKIKIKISFFEDFFKLGKCCHSWALFFTCADCHNCMTKRICASALSPMSVADRTTVTQST